jgi:polysaccharide export outer membrane protein
MLLPGLPDRLPEHPSGPVVANLPETNVSLSAFSLLLHSNNKLLQRVYYQFKKRFDMKKTPDILKTTGLVIFLAAILLTSCVPMKRIRYLQDPKKEKEARTEFEKAEAEEYLVHKGDNLFIKVNTLEDKNNYFDEPGGATNYYSESGIYLNSYTVNDSGYVEFPLIGKIMVNNFTIEQIQKELQRKVNDYVKNTIVIVKLANYRISMLGEFKNPGKYLVYQDKINIFEAIAMAGDMTDFAKRDEVLLVRQGENGAKTKRLNLNDYSLLESEYYYLMPNDLVYVEPLKGKQFAFKEFPYLLILTTITTTVLLIDYFK